MGLNQEQFQAGISQYMSSVISGLPDPAAEKKLIGENADARLAAIQTWAETKFTDPAKFAAVQQIAETAAGFKVLEELRAELEGKRPSIADADATGDNGELTKEDVQKLMATPAYYDQKNRDPKVVEKVNKWFREQGGRR
jgi:hypothetical protein